MLVEIAIGFALGIVFYKFQDDTSKNVEKMTQRIDNLTQEKAEAEQKHKVFECQRIIEHLQNIQQTEIGLKEQLNIYVVGDPANDWLKFYAKLTVQPITHSIKIMKDAMDQLQGKLDDDSLRHEFLNYVDAFKVLPKWILIDNIPQQDHQLDHLLLYIDEQMGKIQKLIDRFVKERDSS